MGMVGWLVFSPAILYCSQYFTELVSSQLLAPPSDIAGRVMISETAPAAFHI